MKESPIHVWFGGCMLLAMTALAMAWQARGDELLVTAIGAVFGGIGN